MNRVTIKYAGAELSVPRFIVDNDLWPYDLLIENWPTFCGAGDGFGDFIVPDKLRGAHLMPSCFIHDIDFAIAPSRSAFHFVMANVYFLFNNRALVKAQLPPGSKRKIALHLCNSYALATISPLGWRSFTPEGTDIWELNLVVKEKLDRLARASLS